MPLAQFQTQIGWPLSDMAVVFYLESFCRDRDVCTGGECDNKGCEQIYKTRMLLVRRGDAPKLVNSTAPFRSIPADLKPFAPQRARLESDKVSTRKALQFFLNNILIFIGLSRYIRCFFN